MNTILQWAIRTLAGISGEQWKKLLDLVLQAAGVKIPNEDRKEWVIAQFNKWLAEKKMSAVTVGVMNFLVEAGLRFLKQKGTITT